MIFPADIERLREELYNAINSGDDEKILLASVRLDDLIVRFTKQKLEVQKFPHNDKNAKP